MYGTLSTLRDPLPIGLRSRVATLAKQFVIFLLASTSTSLGSDKFYNIYKHLESSPLCRKSYSNGCFKIIDYTPTPFQLKLKESMDIT